MRGLFIAFVVFFAPTSLSAQTETNPFAKHGLKKVMMATFSKGEFEEFHKNKEVVEIGSILYNVKTKEVIGYIDERIENEMSSATPAMSIDPHCERYPWISPYAYCFNNPIKYIDPDGQDAMLAGSGTKEDPYVITARYYYQDGSLNEDQVKGLNSALSAYNNSGKNGVTEIKNADGSKSFVKYDLSAQGVDNVSEAVSATAFETTSGDTQYYGNIVGTQPSSGNEFGSANFLRVDFNVDNINAGIAGGMNSNSLNKGVAIHEVGHNLGGEHSDGTSVMSMVTSTATHNQIGGTTTVSHSYPSMSNKFTQIIFNRRDTPRAAGSGDGRIWTKKQ